MESSFRVHLAPQKVLKPSRVVGEHLRPENIEEDFILRVVNVPVELVFLREFGLARDGCLNNLLTQKIGHFDSFHSVALSYRIVFTIHHIYYTTFYGNFQIEYKNRAVTYLLYFGTNLPRYYTLHTAFSSFRNGE